MEVRARTRKLADLTLDNYQKLLVFLYITEKNNIFIPVKRLESLVYLIGCLGVIDFDYGFQFIPWTSSELRVPVSAELKAGMRKARLSGYLEWEESVLFYRRGESWVLENVVAEINDFEVIEEKIQQQACLFLDMPNEKLLEAVEHYRVQT